MAHPEFQNQEELISGASDQSGDTSQLVVHIHSKKINRVLLIISFALALISLFAQFSKYLGNSKNGLGLIPMMDLDYESSIPTIVSVQLLFIAAFLFILVGVLKNKKKDKYRWHWMGLAMGFLFMTFDEGASIHELLTMPVRNNIGEGLPSFLTFAWIIPIGIIVIVLSIFYFRFILALPKKTRRMVIISGIVYLGGSVGMEMIGGSYAQAHTIHTLTYNIIVTIEETLEMIGIILLINTLAEYVNKMNGTVSFKLQQ